jgi:hypothetical protein
MKVSFQRERKQAEEFPALTDSFGRSCLSFVRNLNGGAQMQAKFEEADGKRFGTARDHHEAAHIYLGLGLFLLSNPESIIRGNGDRISATKLFHFAGHAFRELGQLNRAADAYWRAGVANAEKVDVFSIRSLARARMCYNEIGESDKSDLMHILEWEARRQLANWPNRILLTGWWLTTSYGTSLSRWVCSLAVFLMSFTVLYVILKSCNALTATHWSPLSAVYFTVVTTATVGYGDIVPSDWKAEFVVIANIIVGYAMLAFGATILGRKILGR